MIITATKMEEVAALLEKLKALPHKTWFGYDQNNSGGYYSGPAKRVFVAAPRESWAQDLLRDAPGYSDRSCSCCGERWSCGDKLNKDEVIARVADLRSWGFMWETRSRDDGKTVPVIAIITLDGEDESE